MTAFDPIVSEITGIMGEQAGLSGDTIYRDNLIANATQDYAGAATTQATVDYPDAEISFVEILKQMAQLEADGALPIEGDKFVVLIHPHTYASLMMDPVFVNMFNEETPNSPIRTGYVGSVLRMNFYVSSNVKEYVDSGYNSTVDVYSALFIARESYGAVGITGLDFNNPDSGGTNAGPMTGQQIKNPVKFIMKDLGSAGAADPLDQRGTVAWKMTLTPKVLNSAWIRNLQHSNVFSND